MACPPVIALATFKGGSGKSTIAACLATFWQAQGLAPALVDADPQATVTQWYSARDEAGDLKMSTPRSIGIRATVEQLRANHFPIIIDTAGFKSDLSVEALAASQLVLIPVKPSPLDVRVALETLALVTQLNRSREPGARPLLVRFVLTMTTPGTVIAKHVRRQMELGRLQLLSTELGNRVSYAEAALRGLTPTITEPFGAAAREIAQLAHEIEGLYPSTRKRQGG